MGAFSCHEMQSGSGRGSDSVALQIFEVNVFQSVHVRGFENHGTGHSSFERLFPACDADAPTIPRLESGKTIDGKGGTQVVANFPLVGQELSGHMTADGV
jgi:hypothetical protein